ncbi:MAG TPA: histidine phosphatase family protein [Opitutaceae bacterium]|nr:histidine phosphatase family protein [Opitutaceae bacterium]
MRCSIAALCIAAAFAAAGAPTDAQLLAALRGGGYTLYFRHAATDLAQQDAQGEDFANCARQRNLSDAGRREARAAGEAIRALALPIGEVVSSPYCRASETASLLFGLAKRSRAVLVRAGPDGKPDYGELLDIVALPPAPNTLRVIVAHNAPRIAYLQEGEVAIIRPLGKGFEVVAQFPLSDWRRLAGK